MWFKVNLEYVNNIYNNLTASAKNKNKINTLMQ